MQSKHETVHETRNREGGGKEEAKYIIVYLEYIEN